MAQLYRSRSARQLRGPHVVHQIRVTPSILFRPLSRRLFLRRRQRLRSLALGVGLLPRGCLRLTHGRSLPLQEVQQRQIEVIGVARVAAMRRTFQDHHLAARNGPVRALARTFKRHDGIAVTV